MSGLDGATAGAKPMSVADGATATVICCPHVTPLDRRLAGLVEFFGIECSLQTPAGPATDLLGRDHDCLMVSAAALGSLLEANGDSGRFLQRLVARTRHLLVYGFRPVASDGTTLRMLSQGLADSVAALGPGHHRYAVTSEWPTLTREFSGLTFGPIPPGLDAVFAGTRPSLRPIVSMAGAPSFAAFTRDGCTIFALACSDIADLEEKIGQEPRPADWFSRVVPVGMFIRNVFGRRSWHSPRSSASFIIDDPLLKERHGFLNYRRLLQAVHDQPFAATIAFIPFNFRRSQASVVDLFRSRPDRLSLCIHGCDHTGGEFATRDLSALNAMSRTAADRMRIHEMTTALPYAKTMVFPQGRFSAESLQALRGNGYTAAVNTTPMPEGAGHDDDLTIREWLDVAVTRYHGFPLFVRRYPGDLVNFAFDLFLGKPLLVVEHHTAFRHGYREVADFIAALNSLNAHLRWGSLQETLSHAILQRQVSDESADVRLWSNHALVCNESTTPQRYVVAKRESAEAPRQLLIDGCPVEFTLDRGTLRAAIEAPPLATRLVETVYANSLPAGMPRTGLRAALAIQARRRLSELRDDLLCTRQRLLTFAGLGGEDSRGRAG